MAYDGDTWEEYLPVLNECIKILLTILIGIMMGYFKVLNAKTFLPQATTFVFYVALPLHILKGLGIGIDFYDDSFLWTFIAAFLILRAIALAVGFIMTFASGKNGGIGDVAVMWLALSWISTIILGVPIAGAVFGDPRKGRTYGILAAISSFIFQLPFQLFLLECHVLEKEYIANGTTSTSENSPAEDVPLSVTKAGDPEQPPEQGPITQCTRDPLSEDEEEEVEGGPSNALPEEPEQVVQEPRAPEESERSVSLSLWMEWACTWSIWKKIFGQLLKNPVLWGILVGFFFSLTKIGPRYLNPTSDEYVPGLGWVFTTTTWLGECVSPIALIAMGVWMSDQGSRLIRIPLLSAVLYMLCKLVVVPLLMVGLAKGMNLNNEAGRAAVLIAALPISMASFSLANRYEIGEAVLSANVALGTALILPTILLWNYVMDTLELFPIE
jgi:predicted permease